MKQLPSNSRDKSPTKQLPSNSRDKSPTKQLPSNSRDKSPTKQLPLNSRDKSPTKQLPASAGGRERCGRDKSPAISQVTNVHGAKKKTGGGGGGGEDGGTHSTEHLSVKGMYSLINVHIDSSKGDENMMM